MRRRLISSFALFAAAVILGAPACSSNGGDTPDAGDNNNFTPDAGTPDAGTPDAGATGFEQPAGTVALNFSVDATQRAGLYSDGDLEWKGGFIYDDATRVITLDSSWAGPYPPLYDDGPWTSGGHEPEGATAGDDIFGTTVFFEIPAEEVTIEYGAQTSDGGWIWPPGDNGSVIVPAGATEPITAAGLTLLPGGDVDIKATLDTNSLDSTFTFDSSTDKILLKGTFTDWDPAELAYDDGTHGDDTAGDGVYTYVLSMADSPHILVHSATQQEWVWVFEWGADGSTQEYKNSSNEALTTGVTVYTKGPSDTDWQEQTITLASNGNTMIMVP